MHDDIILDDNLLQEAFALSNIRSQKELIHLALQEFINKRKTKSAHNSQSLFELAGKIELCDDYDHKQLRQLRHDFD